MGRFLQTEKPHQTAFKSLSSSISSKAKEKGEYKKHLYTFCLPRSCAEENLYPPIRDSVREYFRVKEIKWHDGQDGNPSNHMCDSQACCANFLFPFSDQPLALAALLKPVFPALQEMLPVEDGQYVAFEWIGEENYLGEKITRNGKHTRGANFTSADAAVRFRLNDGRIQLCLIEWKYTESYSSTPLLIAKSGQNRLEIYRHLLEADHCPIDIACLPNLEALFYEPFYQLMRQQLLSHEMEKAHELCADVVSLLHIAPAHNHDFRRITSPELARIYPGLSATEVWQQLVKQPDRFTSISTEALFGSFILSEVSPELDSWREYTIQRYGWVINS